MDGSGEIDYNEWCLATINKNELINESNLREAFALFDEDNNGSIDANEIGRILGYNLSKEKKLWQEVIKEADLNGDG